MTAIGGWKIEIARISHRTWSLGTRLRVVKYSLRLRQRRRLLSNFWTLVIGRPSR